MAVDAAAYGVCCAEALDQTIPGAERRNCCVDSHDEGLNGWKIALEMDC